MNRRDFLKLGSGAAAVSVGSVLLPLALSPGRSKLPAIHTVIVEQSSVAAMDYGDRMAHLGYRVQRTQGDITALWYDDLRVASVSAPTLIAGMTTFATYSLIEQMARDHWMTTLFEAVHVPAADGGITHLLSGAGAQVDYLKSGFGELSWIDSLVTTATGMGLTHSSVEVFAERVSSRGNLHEQLISWVIGPVNGGRWS